MNAPMEKKATVTKIRVNRPMKPVDKLKTVWQMNNFEITLGPESQKMLKEVITALEASTPAADSLAELRKKIEALRTEQRQFVGWKSRHKIDALDAVLKLIDEAAADKTGERMTAT